MNLDWSAVNTALLLAVGGFLWHQSRVVDSVRQALFGVEGQGGALAEIKILRERTHDLAGTMQVLNTTVELLNRTLEKMPHAK